MYDIPRDAPLVYISFSANIQQNSSEKLIFAAAECANAGVKQVNILFSTSGGKVTNGINVYNILRAMPYKLVMHNVANVDSIGNVVFLAAEERYAVPAAIFMFHSVGIEISDTRLDIRSGRERLESIQSDENRMINIISEHVSLSRRQIDQLFHRQREKDVEFALKSGIITEVKVPKIEPGTPVIALMSGKDDDS